MDPNLPLISASNVARHLAGGTQEICMRERTEVIKGFPVLIVTRDSSLDTRQDVTREHIQGNGHTRVQLVEELLHKNTKW